MSYKKILIYGCIAQPRAILSSPLPSGWKGNIKVVRDRMLWAVGSTAMLDYRNYDAPYPTNVGDIAIAEAVRNQLRSKLSEVEFINLNWGELGTLDDKVLRSDFCLIVIAGSGYFFVNNDGRLAQRVAQDLLFLERIDTPVVLYGVGVNWLYRHDSSDIDFKLFEHDRNCLKRFLRRVTLASVRDPMSQWLLSFNADKTVDLLCDPALFLELGDRGRGARKLLNSANAPCIGINFPFHGPLSTAILKKNLSLYVKMLGRIRAETGGSFHYFVHSHSEFIIARLLQDKGVDVEIIAGSPYHLSERYGEMNLHIGGMLHSCILAVGAGTPSILLAYDVKHRGFAELFDLTPHCHDMTQFNSDALIESVRQILSNELFWRESIEGQLIKLRRNQQQFLESCISLIREG